MQVILIRSIQRQIQFGFDYDMAQLIFPQLVTLDEKQQPIDWAAESP